MGSGKASLIEAKQGAIDNLDAACPDYIVQFDLRAGVAELETIRGTHATRSARPLALSVDIGDGLTPTIAHAEDDILIGPPDTEARYKIDRPNEVSVLGLPMQWTNRVLKEASVPLDIMLADAGRVVRRPNAAAILRVVRREIANSGHERPLFFDGLILQLLSALTDRTALSPFASITASDVRIARVVDYVEDNIVEPFDLDTLASVAGLSRTHLMRVFRATVGQSVWTFVQHRRVERAREMICGSRLPLAEIALACGFGNQTHMTKAFRGVLGTTPGAVRRSVAQ